MGEADNLFNEEHVRRYRETGGKVGHIWREGSTILLLTTTGRTSGEKRTTPLIYAEDAGRYVIVASKGGAPDNPGWYKNLEKNPEVELQVKDEVFPARARVAHGEERARFWKEANKVWRYYDDYAKKTSREIPVVVLERSQA
jgi:deazaflavin-dependent oxidoreductase (nitroreductase family)